jgi:tetratricopeptide (TPR) repeat protein
VTFDQDHYQVLGVSEDASEAEIEKAFYQKVREHPPEQDEEGHKRIREAYDVLINQDSRDEYDALRRSGGQINQLREEAERLLNQENPDFDAAIKKLKKAVVLGGEIGLLRNQLGSTYLQSGRPADALEQFNKAIELDQETSENYVLNRGHALRELGRPDEAERAFRSVWEGNEGDYAAARALAGVLINQEEFDEAHEVLDTAIWADDKLDFEDFFCYHDKLQLYVLEGETEVLAEELETVKDLPETKDDETFAAYMLASTAQDLGEIHAYSLARDFIAAAIELDPDNPRLRELQEFIQENADLQESVKEINESEEIHEVVKHSVSSCYQIYLSLFEKKEAKNKLDEIYELLENALTVDPHNKEIKESAKTIKEEYPEVYGLNDDVFESILSAPVAAFRIDDCPHCGDPVQFEKGSSGRGTCSGCSGDIRISGTEVRPVSTTTQTSTGRSGGATVGSQGSTKNTTEKSSRSGESEKSLEEDSSGGVFSSKLFWFAVVVGFIIPPHIGGLAILIGVPILYSFFE